MSLIAGMKRAILVAAFLTMLAGCVSKTAVVADKAGPTIPAFYARYSQGIAAQPTDADVAQALQLGSTAKDSPAMVKDAYLSKATTGGGAPQIFYIIVRTPLFLIARHALEQAMAGLPPNQKYIAFARGLGLVKLAVSERYISLATWNALATGRNLILLRDGVRVKPVASMPAWDGTDPFFDAADPLASWQSGSWLKHGVEDMEMQSLLQRQERTEQAMIRKGPGAGRGALIALEPTAAIFSAVELRKPGRYEIVLRQPRPGPPGAKPGPEIRFPISFSRFP
jgi:hypothetical protein